MIISFAKGAEVVPNEYIIKLKKDAHTRSFFKSSKVEKIVRKVKRVRVRYSKLFKIKVRPGIRISQVKKFKSHPMVDFIEPNYIHTTPKIKKRQSLFLSKRIPEDELFPRLWGLNNKNRTDINVLSVWDKTMGSKKIIIAIVDTGLDINHPDLKENLWVNTLEKNGEVGVDDDGNGYIDDIHGYNFVEDNSSLKDRLNHGTHVAGTVGAVHNKIGVTGVMKDVSLMTTKIFAKDKKTTTEMIVEGITYTVNNGAHIQNHSWGWLSHSQAIKEAIEYANKRGSLIIASAGNSSVDMDEKPQYPAGYKLDNIIAVAAYGIEGKKAPFTNYGKRSVHVAAPGLNIISTVDGGYYAMNSGTSMAAPHVSGAIGLILSLNSQWVAGRRSKKLIKVPTRKIRNLLIKTSQKTNFLKNISVSNGRIDTAKAVNTLLKR